MTESLVGGTAAAPLSMRATAVVASAIVRAARQLLADLERGRRIDAAVLRSAMEAAFCASDATGAWNWKTAYDACEAATVLFLRRYGIAMRVKAPSPAAMLPMLMRITGLLPTQTRRSSVPLKMISESHWVEVDRERFSAAWLAELAGVPEFSESTIHVVAGLLLPIWKRLPNESTLVYRLQTDAGERIIGRKVSATWVANVLSSGAPELAPDVAFAALTAGRTVLDLAEGLEPRRVRVMGAHRTELSGFNDAMRDRLRSCGLFGEIIFWKLRMFAPTDADDIEVLAKLLDRYAIERTAEREAA